MAALITSSVARRRREESTVCAVCVFRKVYHVKKQLLGLSGQLISIEKEVTMLMDRALKVTDHASQLETDVACQYTSMLLVLGSIYDIYLI